MSNTNNHDGLILMIAATAIICSVIIVIDTGKRSVKIASHFSVLKVPSVIYDDDNDEQYKQPTMANK